MKHENLFRAIGQVEDTLIQEAEETKQLTFPAHTVPWRQWCALAAALVVVIGLGVFVRPMLQAGSSADSAVQNVESGAEEATEEEWAAEAEPEEGAEAAGEAYEETSASFPLLTVTGMDSTAVEGEALEVFEWGADSETGQETKDSAGGETTESQDAGTAEFASALATVACGPDGALTLDFGENPPEQVTVSWYQEDAWASGAGTPDAETVTDGTLTPPDSGQAWIAEITAVWTQGDSARYVFRVMPGA